MGHDVFISYAHVDNEPLPPASEGWVNTLVRALKVRLAQKLGRREACNIWMDGLLAGNDPEPLGGLNAVPYEALDRRAQCTRWMI